MTTENLNNATHASEAKERQAYCTNSYTYAACRRLERMLKRTKTPMIHVSYNSVSQVVSTTPSSTLTQEVFLFPLLFIFFYKNGLDGRTGEFLPINDGDIFPASSLTACTKSSSAGKRFSMVQRPFLEGELLIGRRVTCICDFARCNPSSDSW